VINRLRRVPSKLFFEPAIASGHPLPGHLKHHLFELALITRLSLLGVTVAATSEQLASHLNWISFGQHLAHLSFLLRREFT